MTGKVTSAVRQKGPPGAMLGRVLPSPGRRACLSRVSFPTLTNPDHPPSLRLCWSGCASTFRGARTSAHGGARVKNARRSKMSVISFGPEFREALTVGVKHRRGRGGKSRSRSGSPDPLGAAKSVPAAPSYDPPTPTYRRFRHRSQSYGTLPKAQSAPAAFSDERPAAPGRVLERQGLDSVAFVAQEYSHGVVEDELRVFVFSCMDKNGILTPMQIKFGAGSPFLAPVTLTGQGVTVTIASDDFIDVMCFAMEYAVFSAVDSQVKHDLVFGAPTIVDFLSQSFDCVKNLNTMFTGSTLCETLINIAWAMILGSLLGAGAPYLDKTLKWIQGLSFCAVSVKGAAFDEALKKNGWTDGEYTCGIASHMIRSIIPGVWDAICMVILSPPRDLARDIASLPHLQQVAGARAEEEVTAGKGVVGFLFQGLQPVLEKIKINYGVTKASFATYKTTAIVLRKIFSYLSANQLRLWSSKICDSIGMEINEEARRTIERIRATKAAAAGGAGTSGVQTSEPGKEQEDTGGARDTSDQTTTRRRNNTRTFKGVYLS